MGRKKKDLRINNFAVIQYVTAKGQMKVLAISDYDIRKLKNRVAIHMAKRVLSIQFYYEVSTNTDIHVLKKGVILE